MKLMLEFSGGMELLFGGQKEIHADVPLESPTVAHLLVWMRDNLVKARPELFMKGETVRPGILVLINESDWELCGMLEAQLSDGDHVVFISTLHGGWALDPLLRCPLPPRDDRVRGVAMVKGFKERDGSQPGTSSGRQALAAEGGPCNAASFALLETVRLALESSEAEEQNSGGHTTSEGYTSSDHYVPDAAPRRRVANINAARHALPGGPCAHCSALESPQWRRHLGNNCVLCNACGIFYRRHQCLPARKKEADHPRRPKAEPVDLEDDHMMGCSDDNENPTRGDAPRGRESASSMEWPAVLHTTAMEPTALKQEGGGGAFGLGFGACHGRPAALMLDLPTLATASSITDGAHGGCGHGQGQGHGGGGALRRAASGGMGGGSSRGPGTPRRTGAILEALLESPPHAGDGGDEYGRRVRSRGPTPHGTPKGGGGGGGGRGGGSFAPPGASAFASQPSVMAALMASVLRQSLGVADPSMHALAAGTSLPHPYTHPHSMHTSASCPVVEERPRREVATGVVQVQVQQSAGAPGAAFFLPKATCRGPSFLAATKSV